MIANDPQAETPADHINNASLAARTSFVRVAISAIAAVLLVCNFAKILPFDSYSLVLVGLLVLPWLPSVLDSAKLPGGWELQFRKVEIEQRLQRQDLDDLRFLMRGFLTENELLQLRKIASGEPFTFKYSPSFEQELRRLLGIGFIARLPNRTVTSLFRDKGDVCKYLTLTKAGTAYLRRMDEIEASRT